jgi:hypothetical protein
MDRAGRDRLGKPDSRHRVFRVNYKVFESIGIATTRNEGRGGEAVCGTVV